MSKRIVFIVYALAISAKQSFPAVPFIMLYKVVLALVGAGMAQWRSGESTRLPPVWPGFDSRSRRHMWVDFAVGSRPCSEGFSPGTPVFLPPQKPTFPNSNSAWKQ